MKGLFQRKPMKSSFIEMEEGQHQLKRHLNGMHLVMIGIGSIIGAGIFVISGQAAALYAGPAVSLSFIFAALICALAGLCYAELASLIPYSGGSYSYTYVSIGEFPAWLVAWAVSAQYLITSSTVAVGWSGYFISFLKDLGISFPSAFLEAPVSYSATLGWHSTGAIFNLPAVVLILLLGALIAVGIRAATYFNNVMVLIKLTTVFLFVMFGLSFINTDNWIPFIPENTGNFGEFGWSGILRGAGIVFFAYLGFDSVSTLSQDAINPQKDLPRGILGSLFICTAAYIITSLVLVGVVHYSLLDVPDPMAIVLRAMGPKFFWFQSAVQIAILLSLTTVAMVQMLVQSRLFLAVSKDGLLPRSFAKLHPKKKTPLFSTAITTLIVVVFAGLLSVDVLAPIVSITTLFTFSIVCLGVLVLRRTHPEFKRGFKVPFVPFVPIFGIVACVVQMAMLPLSTWILLTAWFLIGILIYFSYGTRFSKVRNG